MRPGVSTQALAGPVAVGVRVDSSRGGRVLAGDIPVSSVKVEATAERVVPSMVSFTAPPEFVPRQESDPLANFGQRVMVSSLMEVEGRVEVVPFGSYLITEWEETGDGVSVTAVDLMRLVEDNPLAWPSSPPAGATLSSELKRLAGSVQTGGGLAVAFEGRDRPVSRNLQYGTSRSEAIRDLCESNGLLYAVKADGCLHVWDEPDSARPVVVYSARDLLVDAARKSQDRVANQVIVAGSPQGDDAVQWTATRQNFSGEYAPNLYGLVTSRHEFNAAASQESVEKAAQTYLRNAMNTRSVRSLGVAFDPRIELGDDISAWIEHDDGSRETVTGRVVAVSAVLDDPDQLMRIDVKELWW